MYIILPSCSCHNKLHRLSGLNQHKFIFYSSVGQKSDVGYCRLKSRHQQGRIPFWRFCARIHFFVFSSFQRSPTFLDSQPLPPSSKPGTLLFSDSRSIITAPSDSSASVFHFKDPCEYIVVIVLGNLFICVLALLIPSAILTRFSHVP